MERPFERPVRGNGCFGPPLPLFLKTIPNPAIFYPQRVASTSGEFSAQYQQAPIPPGGTIIKRKWLKTYEELRWRQRNRIVMSWDIALSERETGDFAACVVLLIREETVCVLEVLRGRFPFEALKAKIIEFKRQRYQISTLLIEESPISLGLIQSLRERSINVTTYKPDTDKRFYRGEITHKGNAYPAEHQPIVDEVLWDQVQAILAENRVYRATCTFRKPHPQDSQQKEENRIMIETELSTAASFASMVMTASPRQASATLAATFAPCAVSASAFARVRLKTVTSCPTFNRLTAIPAPICPRPIKPTFIVLTPF
jgi:hypothetical protein